MKAINGRNKSAFTTEINFYRSKYTQNFRVKLSRARKELHNYMEYRCGLIKKSNPCRCVKKAKSALKMGVINERNLILKSTYTSKIGDFVTENQGLMTEVLDQKYIEIFRNHPSKSEFDAQTIVSKIINDETIKNLFNI